MAERAAVARLKQFISKNKLIKSLIGKGYNSTVTPYPIRKHLLQNPKWYTPYTPYQSEISQGRLESLHNYQKMVSSLSGLPLTNASLLDEGSTAAEVMTMSYNYHKNKKNKFFVSETMHPQVLDVLETRANAIDIDMRVSNVRDITFDDNTFGFMFQYPDTNGEINIPLDLIKESKDRDIVSTCSNDLLASCLIKSPGEIDVDMAFGSMQRFGVPLFFGGPHPAYLACDTKFMRHMPGRIVGKSVDTYGNEGYRICLQTREQHIKQDKATSNICTSQALLANVTAMYAINHGRDGILEIAKRIHNLATDLKTKCLFLGYEVVNENYFDTITIKTNVNKAGCIYDYLKRCNLLVYRDDGLITFSLGETTTDSDIDCIYKILGVFSSLAIDMNYVKPGIPTYLLRREPVLKDEIFDGMEEVELTRYMHDLADKDYSLVSGMVPLGSCTMKLNPSYTLEPLLWDKITNIHPFAPPDTCAGYMDLINKTGDHLKEITGFSHCSFQPNSGAMGEYTGLLCIKKYHEGSNRNICLIPKSAHGTNFASAKLANLKIVKFDDSEFDNFSHFVSKYKDTLACLMITYPNTSGLFQENIREITKIIHENGGLVYMDGANMNALAGKEKPGDIGADVCHLNLHKTFCIPHGGGGPGMGPIFCNDKLGKYLPTNHFQTKKNENSIGSVTSSQWSSASILTIPYLYITNSSVNLKENTEKAIENANYIKNRLSDYYNVEQQNVAHEFIIDLEEFKEYNITDVDIAKRLMDYSFHPPTMSWPKLNSIMVEPTESESKEELDRFIDAMISIRGEIDEIKEGRYSQEQNVLKNAPHTLHEITHWSHSYPMKKAFFPVRSLEKKKFWPQINRLDDKYGDKLMYDLQKK